MSVVQTPSSRRIGSRQGRASEKLHHAFIQHNCCRQLGCGEGIVSVPAVFGLDQESTCSCDDSHVGAATTSSAKGHVDNDESTSGVDRSAATKLTDEPTHTMHMSPLQSLYRLQAAARSSGCIFTNTATSCTGTSTGHTSFKTSIKKTCCHSFDAGPTIRHQQKEAEEAAASREARNSTMSLASFRRGLCLSCGSPGHIYAECPSRGPKPGRA